MRKGIVAPLVLTLLMIGDALFPRSARYGDSGHVSYQCNKALTSRVMRDYERRRRYLKSGARPSEYGSRRR
jgi:hypothetical protein